MSDMMAVDYSLSTPLPKTWARIRIEFDGSTHPAIPVAKVWFQFALSFQTDPTGRFQPSTWCAPQEISAPWPDVAAVIEGLQAQARAVGNPVRLEMEGWEEARMGWGRWCEEKRNEGGEWARRR